MKIEKFMALEKVDAEQRIVYGVIACEEADGANEIMDYELSKAEFTRWSEAMMKASDGASMGNVREMHSRSAAGKLTAIEFDDAAKKVRGAVKVVDDAAWEKVLEGVYTGFSMGGGYAKRWKDPANTKLTRYIPAIVELSLVDSPCMKSATFELVKADGSKELRKFINVELGDLEQGFRSKDGTFFLQKVLAVKHNEKLEKEAQAAAAEVAVSHPALDALKKIEETVTQLEGEKLEKAEKAPRFTDALTLQKGLMEVARLAALLQELQWLCECVTIEQKLEDDTASMEPAKLKADISALATTLEIMVTEEVAELSATAEKMDKVFEGFTLEKMQREKLSGFQKLEKILAEIKEPEQEAQAAPDAAVLEKINSTLAQATDELSKAREAGAAKDKLIDELGGGLEKLRTRLETIERQPMPRSGPLRAVDRETERKTSSSHQSAQPKEPEAMMPPGLSPRDQREWMARQTRKTQH